MHTNGQTLTHTQVSLYEGSGIPFFYILNNVYTCVGGARQRNNTKKTLNLIEIKKKQSKKKPI